MRSNKRRIGFICLCVVPASVLFFWFMLLPTFNVFRYSLYKWGRSESTFIGFKNFVDLFTGFSSKNFIQSLQNTTLIIVVVTIITFFFAIVFAAILTREKLKGQNFFRVIFYIPNILSVTVIAGVFSAIYAKDANEGLLNAILSFFKGELVALGWKFELAMVSLIIAMVWQAIGYYMVMYMSSMSAVSLSLYESAGLDGAGRLKQFFQITLPLIWTNLRTTLTFFIISTINMAFLFIRALWGTANLSGTSLDNFTTLNYMATMKGRGMQMAVGVVIFLFSFLLSALVSKVTKRDVLEV